MTSTKMLVRIDTKNWRGNYNSRVVRFNSRRHLDNYMAKALGNQVGNNEITSKVIGFEILDQ